MHWFVSIPSLVRVFSLVSVVLFCATGDAFGLSCTLCGHKNCRWVSAGPDQTGFYYVYKGIKGSGDCFSCEADEECEDITYSMSRTRTYKITGSFSYLEWGLSVELWEQFTEEDSVGREVCTNPPTICCLPTLFAYVRYEYRQKFQIREIQSTVGAPWQPCSGGQCSKAGVLHSFPAPVLKIAPQPAYAPALGAAPAC